LFAVPLGCGVQVPVLGPAGAGDRGVGVDEAFVFKVGVAEVYAGEVVVEGGHL